MKEFLAAMYRFVPPDARVMLCAFRGDPMSDADPGRWRARPITDYRQVDQEANIYLCVSAMKANERGEFRRRKENFAGGILLMIDDLGDGAGSKFPLSLLHQATPTALIETSPGNFQAVFMFDRLVKDQFQFEALINGFIAKQFLGKDTGMAGINRVFRPPAGVNGKPKYGGWRVRLAAWNPAARYSPEELAHAFGIDLTPPAPRLMRGDTVSKADSIRAFVTVRSALRSAGMLKRERSDLSGWQDIVCPWTDSHTGGANNGAAIREPAEENDWHGAFRCHHGGCAERGWRDLTEWLAEKDDELLSAINQNAGEFEDYIK